MKVNTYVFVGVKSLIGDREFSEFGQRAQFTEAQYEQAVKGGAAFIEEVSFKKIGFTVEEIAAYGSIAKRSLAPKGFLEKVEIAVQVFRDTRKLLREGRLVVEPAVADSAGDEGRE